MEADSLEARIQHEIADLRGRYPRIGVCHASLEDWHDGMQPRHALQLDIRWPQHQSLISGPARVSAEEAVGAAFDLATRSLEQAHA
jgi:hypothetical protein